MRIILAISMVGSLVGCGAPTLVVPNLVPTQGQLLSGKKPAAGAVLLFHPAGQDAGQLPPRAKVDSDGRFTIVSADGSIGLPERDYLVTVEWRIGSGENGADGRRLVAERYTRSSSTPLKVSVRPGPDGNCVLPTFTLTP